MRILAVLVLPFVVLPLAACGGGADNEAAAADPTTTAAAEAPAGDPCRFVSAAEMSAITTDTVTETKAEDDTCTYKTRHGDDLGFKVRTSGGAAEMANANRAAGLLSGMGQSVAEKGGAGRDAAAILAKSKDAPGVGDEAMWGIAGILYARKGDAYVEVYPPNLHDPATHPGYPLVSRDDKRRITVAIAKQVFARTGG